MTRKAYLTALGTFLTVFGLAVFTSGVVIAQSEEETNNTLEEIEQERIKQLEEDLELKIPNTTDEPSYTLNFKLPEGQESISIQVDDEEFEEATSPFVLPALAIGEHQLILKYKDKEGALKVISQDLIVVPKAPIFAADNPTKGDNNATQELHGTAIPQATITLIQNSRDVITTESDSEGEWRITTKELLPGRNSFIAQANKNGFASAFSKSVSISTDNDPTISSGNSGTQNNEPWYKQIQEWAENNEQQIIIAGSGLLLIMLVLAFSFFWRRRTRRAEEKSIADILKIDKLETITTKLKGDSSPQKEPSTKSKKDKNKKKEEKESKKKEKKSSKKKTKAKSKDKNKDKGSKTEDKNKEKDKKSNKTKDSEKKKEDKQKPKKKILSKKEFLKRFKRS